MARRPQPFRGDIRLVLLNDQVPTGDDSDAKPGRGEDPPLADGHGSILTETFFILICLGMDIHMDQLDLVFIRVQGLDPSPAFSADSQIVRHCRDAQNSVRIRSLLQL